LVSHYNCKDYIFESSSQTFILDELLNCKYVNIFVFKDLLKEKWPDISMIVFAILALFNPVLTAVLLLDVFRRYPSLKNILKSVMIAKTALILTLVLFIILTYIFTLVVYYFFWSDLSYVCHNLWTCFLYLFDRTFKSDAGYVSTF